MGLQLKTGLIVFALWFGLPMLKRLFWPAICELCLCVCDELRNRRACREIDAAKTAAEKYRIWLAYRDEIYKGIFKGDF